MTGKKRLVILANHRKARFVLTNGIKVDQTLLCLLNQEEAPFGPLSHHGTGHDKGTADSHFFPSHTHFKDIEKEAFAHEIAKEALRHQTDSGEVVLVCEPKMLGLLKKELAHHRSVSVYKAFSFDMVDIDDMALEEKLLEPSKEA